jgi:hypothetical protein
MGGKLEDQTSVVYVSPLKALSNDIQKNLREPLRAIRQLAEERGTPLPEIRVAVRTGDTPAKEREFMRRRPPHILITTPESLYIVLTVDSRRTSRACAPSSAVPLRRVNVDLAGGVGALDQAAIDEVKSQAWPDVRDADELHDALLSLVLLPAQELGSWREWMGELVHTGRATRITWNRAPEEESRLRPAARSGAGEPRDESRERREAGEEGHVATERVEWVQAALPAVTFEAETPAWASRGAIGSPTEEEAVRRIVQGWMEAIGPTMELPAPAWEREVLPSRIARYSGADLEQLCLSGAVAWGRLRLRDDSAEDEEMPRRRQMLTRSASLGLVLREYLPHLLEPGPVGAGDGIAGLRLLLTKGEAKREPQPTH